MKNEFSNEEEAYQEGYSTGFEYGLEMGDKEYKDLLLKHSLLKKELEDIKKQYLEVKNAEDMLIELQFAPMIRRARAQKKVNDILNNRG